MKLKPVIAQCLLAMTTLSAAATASAAPISYEFSGTVASDSAERGWQVFSGSFSFDSAASDAIADVSTAAYAHAGAPWGMSISFDGGASLLLNSSFNVLISNDLGGADQWGLLAQNGDGSEVFSLNLSDLSASVFANDALPLTALTLANFSFNSLRYESGGDELQGQLTDLKCVSGCEGVTPPTNPVPEPASGALVTAGLLALIGRQRRRLMQGA